MGALAHELELRLQRGQRVFSGRDLRNDLKLSAAAFDAAARRLKLQHRLASPHHGFFLILTPHDRAYGAPDPIRWIAPLMDHLALEYRVSLLRAAAHHGSSQQAAMVIHVVATRQLRPIDIGRYRLEFVYQSPEAFAAVNQPANLVRIKSESGFALAAGIELLLLDCVRYMHRSLGLNGVAQIVHDLGSRANPGKLARLATAYENTVVRRLGYLLEYFGLTKHAAALAPYVLKAKSMKTLDPAVRTLPGIVRRFKQDLRWKLVLNRAVEIDA